MNSDKLRNIIISFYGSSNSLTPLSQKVKENEDKKKNCLMGEVCHPKLMVYHSHLCLRILK